MEKIGRNDLCPCGSGQKYKKCCLVHSYTAIGKEQSISRKFVIELLSFFKKNYEYQLDDALDYFWGEFEPEEYLDEDQQKIVEINFWEWLTHDWLVLDSEDKHSQTLIEAFIENRKKFTVDEQKVITLMKNSVISFFEIQEVFPGKGLLVKDLLIGKEYDVRERSASKHFNKWDIFAGRILNLDNQYLLSGSIYPYHIHRKESILNIINDEFKIYKEEKPFNTIHEFLKENGDIFNELWYEPIMNPPNIKMMTTTGDEVLFSTAYFTIQDKKKVFDGLKQIKEFEEDYENTFIWFGLGKLFGKDTVFGRIKITDKELTLSCNSKERLAKGKEIILKNLYSLVKHKVDSYQDIAQAMKSKKSLSNDTKGKNEIPFEIQQQIYTQFQEEQSKKWMHESVPALNGKAPLEAVKTREGKTKVAELLKPFENMEERNKKIGQPYYDMSWMWDELNIERD